MKILLIIISLACQLFVSGCVFMPRKDVRQGNNLFEDVVVSGKRMHMASEDQIIVTSTCPEGYLVKVRKGTKTLWTDIGPGGVVSIYPSSDYRNKPTQFSIMVYRKDGPDETVVYHSDEIIRIGGQSMVASWIVGMNYASLRYDRQPSQYGWGGY